MKTMYQCEICGHISDSRDAAIACEGKCKLSSQLDEIFGNDEWNPPLPIKQYAKWSAADRAEMARRLDGFWTRHYRQREGALSGKKG